MEKYELEISHEVGSVLERTKYEIKRRGKEPVDLDAELPDISSLPAPLIPDLSGVRQAKRSLEKQPPLFSTAPTHGPVLSLEDYLSSGDCTSLLSLDLSGKTWLHFSLCHLEFQCMYCSGQSRCRS